MSGYNRLGELRFLFITAHQHYAARPRKLHRVAYPANLSPVITSPSQSGAVFSLTAAPTSTTLYSTQYNIQHTTYTHLRALAKQSPLLTDIVTAQAQPATTSISLHPWTPADRGAHPRRGNHCSHYRATNLKTDMLLQGL